MVNETKVMARAKMKFFMIELNLKFKYMIFNNTSVSAESEAMLEIMAGVAIQGAYLGAYELKKAPS